MYSVRWCAAACVRVSSDTTRSKSWVSYSGDLLAEEVELPLLRAEPIGIRAEDDAAHPIGSEEAVLDALSQRVREERVAEVGVSVHVVVALWGRGHAELGRRGEVVEYRPPTRAVLGAATVAFVNHDQVEVVRRVLSEDPKVVAGVGQRLVQGEVDLATRLRLALDLVDGVAEGRLELPLDRLVHQDVAVCQIEDPRRPLAGRPLLLPELPGDLHRDEGLPGAGRHREERSLPALDDGGVRTIDRDSLVVARFLDGAIRPTEISIEGEGEDLLSRRRDPLVSAVPVPGLFRR